MITRLVYVAGRFEPNGKIVPRLKTPGRYAFIANFGMGKNIGMEFDLSYGLLMKPR